VRPEIVRRLRLERGQEKAVSLIRTIGEKLSQDPQPVSAERFAEIVKSVKDEALISDMTPLFDLRSIDELPLGKASHLEWALKPDRKEGDLSPRFRTVRGIALYRFHRRNEAYIPQLTQAIREKIAKTLELAQLKALARAAAEELAGNINRRGFAEATAGSSIRFQSTELFRLDGRSSPLQDDPYLGRELNQVVRILEPSRAACFDGSMLLGEKRLSWSFVVYLEERIHRLPKEAGAKLETLWNERTEKLQREKRVEFAEKAVQEARLQDFVNK